MPIQRINFNLFQDFDQRWMSHPSYLFYSFLKIPFMIVPKFQCDKPSYFTKTFINVSNPSMKPFTTNFKMFIKLFQVYAAFTIISHLCLSLVSAGES